MFQQETELATIVVCEDDEATLELLCDHMVADRFDVLPAPAGVDALRFCRYNRPDLMVIDLNLADRSGPELIRAIRESDGIETRFDPHLPIIGLTSSGGSKHRTVPMDVGADYYVQKPFAYDELHARIMAVLRRRHRRQDEPVRVGELLIDPGRRKVTVGDREVHLAKKEFTLLRVLASDPTRVFSKDELLRDIWGLKASAGKTRTVDSHASRLRRKLDPDERRYVISCWGIGYRLVKG